MALGEAAEIILGSVVIASIATTVQTFLLFISIAIVTNVQELDGLNKRCLGLFALLTLIVNLIVVFIFAVAKLV